MSAHSEQSTHDHGDHGHQEIHADHGSVKSYVTGFVLSVILTAIPFWLVMGNVFENSNVAAFTLLGIAAVQIIVHMIYFLHMNTKSEGGWSMLAMLFTVMIVGIVLSGSLWVMYHMNHNMMPHLTQEVVPASFSEASKTSAP